MSATKLPRVLVVNDDPTQLFLTVAVLKKDGMDVTGVSGAAQALEYLVAHEPVDLIVTDLIMPEIDGWRFCRLLRSEQYHALNDIPILAMSAVFSGVDVEEITADVGANAFLPVPHEPNQLRSVARDLLEARLPLIPTRVLVIEDSAVQAKVIQRAFNSKGYVVYVAANGHDGIELYKQFSPEIIVVDFHLPDTEGLELIREFAKSRTHAVIVVVTSDTDPSLALRCIHEGADAHIPKPFDPEYLIEVCGKARREHAVMRTEKLLKERSQRLRESEERYRMLFEKMQTAFGLCEILVDGNDTPYDFRYLEVNQAMEQMVGKRRDELIGKTGLETFPNMDTGVIKRLGEVALTGTHASFEEFSRTIKRHLHIVAYSPKYGQFAMTVTDITDKHRIEEEWRKNQKLDALTLLAGGVAHDFNNILMAIRGNLSLAKDTINPDQVETDELLAEADKACARAKDLTHQLLTFAKGGAPIKQTASLGDIVGESAKFITRGSSCKCVTNIASDLWPAEVDSGQISQVVQNLVINAVQAMSKGGTITIAAENSSVTAEQGLPIPAGRYVKLTVTDTGNGISPENLEKIFSPYFTTKPTGNGLGLTTSLSIIKQHGGYMTVESEAGKGTTFLIYLPAMEAGSDASKDKQPPSISLHSMRILVMDDDEPIRILLSRMLTREGCEVETAANGHEAIEKHMAARAAGKPFNALILDMTVPGGMGAEDTITELKQQDPEARVIVSSGYLTESLVRRFERMGHINVVSKPFRIDDLAGAISKAIR